VALRRRADHHGYGKGFNRRTQRSQRTAFVRREELISDQFFFSFHLNSYHRVHGVLRVSL
jgi:hypothetical protein